MNRLCPLVTLMFPLGALTLAGCAFDDTVPPGSVIECSDTAQCPSGHVCRAFSGQSWCVSAVRPAGVASLEPTFAKAGTELRARVQGGTLARCSLVTTGGERRAFSLEGPDEEGVSLGRYVLQGDEGEGLLPVLVDLRVAGGKTALGVLVGTVTTDFSPPGLRSASLSLRPADTNGLIQAQAAEQLSAVTVGTQVALRLEGDEPISSARVTLVSQDGGVRLPLPVAGPGATSPLLQGELTWAANDEGTWFVELEWSDLIGNVVTLSQVARFLVDQSPPPAPSVDEAGAIVFRRAPEGDLDSQDGGRWSLSGRAGAFPEAVAVSVFAEGIPVAGAALVDGGLLPLSVPLVGDLQTVELRSIDLAGNRSPTAAVRDVDWVVVPGRGSHRFEFVPASTPGLEPPLALPAQLPFEGRGAMDWEEVDQPLGVITQGLAFHGAQARIGGVSAWGGAFDARVRLPGGFDSIIAGPAQILEAVSSEATAWTSFASTIRFGGQLPDGGPSDRQVGFDAGVTPGPLAFARMVFDPVRDEVVLFGGRGVTGVTSGTWTLSPDAGWTRRAPGLEPPARSEHAMTWDALDERVLIHGGRGADGGLLSDVWSWDGQVWRLLGDAPPAMARHGLVRDPVRGGLFFGERFGALYEVTDAGVTQRTPPLQSTSTYGLANAGHCFDSARGEHLFVGGFSHAVDEGDYRPYPAAPPSSWRWRPGAQGLAVALVAGLTDSTGHLACSASEQRFFTRVRTFGIVDAGQAISLGPALNPLEWRVATSADGGFTGVQADVDRLVLAQLDGPVTLATVQFDAGIWSAGLTETPAGLEAFASGPFGTRLYNASTGGLVPAGSDSLAMLRWRVTDPQRGRDFRLTLPLAAPSNPLTAPFRMLELQAGTELPVVLPRSFFYPAPPVEIGGQVLETSPFLDPPTGELYWVTQNRDIAFPSARLHRYDPTRRPPSAARTEIDLALVTGTVEWHGFSARGFAGALGQQGPAAASAPLPGFKLVPFLEDRWVQPAALAGARSSATAAAPAPFSWDVDDASLARRLFRGRRTASFALESLGGTGTVPSALRVDGFELTLRYRRPPP